MGTEGEAGDKAFRRADAAGVSGQNFRPGAADYPSGRTGEPSGSALSGGTSGKSAGLDGGSSAVHGRGVSRYQSGAGLCR